MRVSAIVAGALFWLAFSSSTLQWGELISITFEVGRLTQTPLEFPVLVDLPSLTFGVTVATITGSVLLFSSVYIEEEKFFTRFHLLVLSFVISIFLLIFSPRAIRVLMG